MPTHTPAKFRIALFFGFVIPLIAICVSGCTESQSKSNQQAQKPKQTMSAKELLDLQKAIAADRTPEPFIPPKLTLEDSIQLSDEAFILRDLTLDKIQKEIDNSRKGQQNINETLVILDYNIKFNERAYCESRKEGKGKTSTPCQRLVLMKYFFSELAGKYEAAKSLFKEIEKDLLFLHDEQLVRGNYHPATENVEEKMEKIIERFKASLKKSETLIENIRQTLEDPQSAITGRDWKIGDPDTYMGYIVPTVKSNSKKSR